MKTAKLALTVLKSLLVLAAILCLIGGLLLAVANVSIRRIRARLAEDGRPMTAEAIIPKPVPEWENAALLYESAIKQLQAVQAGDDDAMTRLSSLGADLQAGMLDAAGRKEFTELLARPEVAAALALVEQAVGRPACRFPINWDEGAAILLPHCSGMRALSRIVAARGVVELEAGDAARAWGTALLALKLADALRDEPILISQLVRCAQAQLAFRLVRRLGEAGPPPADLAVAIDAQLAALDDVAPLVASIDGERLLLGEWAFSLPPAKLREAAALLGSGRVSILAAIYLGPLRRIDHAAYLESMRALTAQFAQPYAASRHLAEPRPPLLAIMTRMLVPALGSCRARFVELQAGARLARIRLALARHRAAHGAYPAGLSEMDKAVLPAIPEDPFTSQPFIYRIAGGAPQLYSAGPDGKDDGGKAKPKDGSAGGWDVGE